MSEIKSSPNCHCQYEPRPCYECEYNYYEKRRKPQLVSDCIVVDSLVCSHKVSVVAELSIPLPTLGDIISIGPGGVIDPPLTLTPDISNIVSQTTVLKDMVVITGYLPATVSILGIETPLQISIPFQKEIDCPGVCPEDRIIQVPFKIESTITQGIEAIGISVANVLFKVLLSTNVTATRPVIVKEPELNLVGDVNEDRCEVSGAND